MAIALAVKSVDLTRRKKRIEYVPSFSGTYAINGDTVDFTGATNPNNELNAFPSEAPESVVVQGAAGFAFEPVIGTTSANGKLKVQANSGSIPEFAFSAADLKGATAPAGTEANADQASGPVNAALIIAEATFTAVGTTAYSTIANQPDIGRNLIFVVHNDSGGPLNLFEGAMTVAVVGKFRGAAQTETITLTSTLANKAVANTKFRYIAGSKPFDSVTSITITNPADGGLKLSVAPGSKVGTPVNSATGTDASYIKAMNTAADYALAGKVDHTNKTVDFGTTADNWDFLVEYQPAAGELPNGIAYPAALVAAQADMRIVATFRGVR